MNTLFARLSIALLVMTTSAFLYLRWRVGQTERVELAHVLAATPSTGPTWLLVGSDSREGIDPDRPDAGGLLGEVIVGQRADAIILVREVDTGVQMLSLPRDLWIDPPGDNNATRINAAYNSGAAPLISLISEHLAIPIHHYVEVDLAGLDDIVDSIGGVTVEIAHPGHDASIGLRIDESGPVRLDGATALAYVRTRTWTELVDGRERLDGTGDLGRNLRQQAVLGALARELAGSRNPFTLNAAIAAVASSVRVDDQASLGDLYTLARMLQRSVGTDPLPVRPDITPGGASVLLLDTNAEDVLDRYR